MTIPLAVAAVTHLEVALPVVLGVDPQAAAVALAPRDPAAAPRTHHQEDHQEVDPLQFRDEVDLQVSWIDEESQGRIP